MMLGVVSDPHGNVYGLRATLEALAQAGVEQIVCAGDVVGYYPFVNETIQLLRDYRVSCIAGNHDLYFRREIAISENRWRSYHLDHVEHVISTENESWLRSLPQQLQVTIGDKEILVCHGSPRSPEEYMYGESLNTEALAGLTAQIVIFGHTHIPMVSHVDTTTGPLLLLNPGSCGQPRDYIPLASFGILDTVLGEARIHRTPYDIDAVRRRCEELEFSAPVINILTRQR